MADAPRRSYASRADEIAGKIERICQLRGDPLAFHEAKDDAVKSQRRLALALAADGL